MGKAEARKRISAKEDDIDAAMKAARKYMRIMNYLLIAGKREIKRISLEMHNVLLKVAKIE